MATTIHDTPEWETPRPKQSFLSKHNLFSKPESTLPTTKDESSDSSGNAVATGTIGKPTLIERFNNAVPRDRKYFGRSRKVFLLIVGGAIVLLLAFILGLGLGLGLKHHSSYVYLITHYLPNVHTVLPHFFARGLGLRDKSLLTTFAIQLIEITY